MVGVSKSSSIVFSGFKFLTKLMPVKLTEVNTKSNNHTERFTKPFFWEWQVFEGFFDNYMFSMILFTTVILQVFIVEVGDCITQTKHLTAKQWLFCVVCGAVSFPVGNLRRCFHGRSSVIVFLRTACTVVPCGSRARNGERKRWMVSGRQRICGCWSSTKSWEFHGVALIWKQPIAQQSFFVFKQNVLRTSRLFLSF